MKIQAINSKVQSYKSYSRSKAENLSSFVADKNNSVSLYDNKVSFYGIKNLFLNKLRIKEKIKSHEIRQEISDVLDIANSSHYFSKDVYSDVKWYQQKGKEQNFKKPYIPRYYSYSYSDEGLHFEDIDKENGYAKHISVVNMKKDKSVIDEYIMPDGPDGIITYKNYDKTSGDEEFVVQQGKLISYTFKDREANIALCFVPKDDGFAYFEGTLDENGEPLTTIKEIRGYNDPSMPISYKERNDNGGMDEYIYLKKNHICHKK